MGTQSHHSRRTVDRLPRLACTLCRCCSVTTEGQATSATSRGRGIARWSGMRGCNSAVRSLSLAEPCGQPYCAQTPDMLVISLYTCSSLCRALLHISTLPTTPPLPVDDVSTPRAFPKCRAAGSSRRLATRATTAVPERDHPRMAQVSTVQGTTRSAGGSRCHGCGSRSLRRSLLCLPGVHACWPSSTTSVTGWTCEQVQQGTSTTCPFLAWRWNGWTGRGGRPVSAAGIADEEARGIMQSTRATCPSTRHSRGSGCGFD